jgi:hypothetical protein
MPHIHCVTLGAPVVIKSHSKLIFQKLNLNLELGKVQCSSSKNWSPVQASFVVKIKRVPKRLSRMAQNSAWSMTGMSNLLVRDTTAGLLACKRRRLESEQQSTSDLSRRHNLCAVLDVVTHDLETDRASVCRRNRLDWDKYLQEMSHNHFRSMFRMSHA